MQTEIENKTNITNAPSEKALELKSENNSSECNQTVTPLATSPKQKKLKNKFSLMPGFAWNPLLTLPRNMKCPCMSGKKFKVCCLQKLPRAVPEKDAESYKHQMSQPILVFRTATNTEDIKRLMTPEAIAEMDARDKEREEFLKQNAAAIANMEKMKEGENATPITDPTSPT